MSLGDAKEAMAVARGAFWCVAYLIGRAKGESQQQAAVRADRDVGVFDARFGDKADPTNR